MSRPESGCNCHCLEPVEVFTWGRQNCRTPHKLSLSAIGPPGLRSPSVALPGAWGCARSSPRSHVHSATDSADQDPDVAVPQHAREVGAWQPLGPGLVETAGFTRLEENLRYRDPKHLDAISFHIKTPEEAQALLKAGPQAIANRFYSNRLGNGNEVSGDGWRYRGSGYLLITGRSNYEAQGRLLGHDLEAKPEMAREPVTAARLAFAYWDCKGLSKLADGWQLTEITQLVNGRQMLQRKARILVSNRTRVLLLQIWNT
jgi:putative chitinase